MILKDIHTKVCPIKQAAIIRVNRKRVRLVQIRDTANI
jgi:hypothetical protein